MASSTSLPLPSTSPATDQWNVVIAEPYWRPDQRPGAGGHPTAINSVPAPRHGRFEADGQTLARFAGFNPPGC